MIILGLILLNSGCDLVSKKMVRARITNDESIQFLGNHLTLTRVQNTGAFLSLGDQLPKSSRNILLSILPLMLIAFGTVYYLSRDSMAKSEIVGISLIIGGGIGNVFDRFVYGSVTDFLFVRIGFFHTGIFNFADLSIMTGTFVFLFHAFAKYRQ
jgi:signal peptidase II